MAATHQPQPSAGLGPTSTSTSTSLNVQERPHVAAVRPEEEVPGAGQPERRVVVEEGGVEDFVNDENGDENDGDQGEEGASHVVEEKGKEKASGARRNSLREESAYQPSPKLSSSRRSVGCPICFEPIRDPRLLRVCGHTFCYDCLKRAHFNDKQEGWVMDEAIAIPCPMCRTVTHVSSASDLPRNWSLIYDSSDEEEDYLDDLAVPLSREDLHQLPPEDTDSFCRWIDKTQDAGLPQRMLEEYEKRRANQQPSKESSKVTFLLLGLTGHGKSSLINLLFGRLVSAQGHSQESTTQDVALYEHPLVDGLYFIDTPGFFDSRGEAHDEANEAKIKRFLKGHPPDCVILVCKFSDTQSSAMQKGIRFAKEVLEAYGCQVVVVLTYSNTKSLGHLASCEEEFQTLKSQRRKKEAVLCRWNAWRQAKEHYLRSELGEAIRVCAVDNDELSKTNHNGERILLNGEPWVPQLVEHILEAKDLAASRIAQGLEKGTADAEVQSATKKCIVDRMRQVLAVASVSGATGGALVIYEATALVAAEGGSLSLGAMLGAGAAGAALTAVPVLVVGSIGVLVSTAMWNMWTQWKRQDGGAPAL